MAVRALSWIQSKIGIDITGQAEFEAHKETEAIKKQDAPSPAGSTIVAGSQPQPPPSSVSAPNPAIARHHHPPLRPSASSPSLSPMPLPPSHPSFFPTSSSTSALAPRPPLHPSHSTTGLNTSPSTASSTSSSASLGCSGRFPRVDSNTSEFTQAAEQVAQFQQELARRLIYEHHHQHNKEFGGPYYQDHQASRVSLDSLMESTGTQSPRSPVMNKPTASKRRDSLMDPVERADSAALGDATTTTCFPSSVMPSPPPVPPAACMSRRGSGQPATEPPTPPTAPPPPASLSTSTLFFPLPLNKYIMNTLVVQNLTKQFVLFKVKATAPTRYVVKPRHGILGPECQDNIHITLRPTEENPDTMSDKFLIETRIMADTEVEYFKRTADLASLSQKPSTLVYGMKVKCKFVEELPCHYEMRLVANDEDDVSPRRQTAKDSSDDDDDADVNKDDNADEVGVVSPTAATMVCAVSQRRRHGRKLQSHDND